MTRKDYRLLATTIAKCIVSERQSHHAEIVGMETLTIAIMRAFADNYLNFDRAQFEETCGVIDYRRKPL